LWCHESGIQPYKLRNPKLLTVDDLSRLSHKIETVNDWPVHVDDTPNLTVAQLAARARLMVKRHGCELLIVDYVQLINCDAENNHQRVTAVSQALMALKKELQISILALSQLWRPKNGPNDRPSKYSFKESGSLENDADCVLAIYRPVDEDQQFMEGKEEINVMKQREGKIGIVPVAFDENALLFRAR
jgi:replicative DNA helicase